jgi:hypothetical protein
MLTLGPSGEFRYMNQANRSEGNAKPSPRLNLFRPQSQATMSVPAARWNINGFPAILIIWTQEQWANLKERPNDAQYHPNGLWFALRME